MMLGGCGEGPIWIPWDYEGCETRGIVLKAWHSGASLVVQWLRLHTSNAGGTSSNLAGKLRSHMLWGTAKKKKKNQQQPGTQWFGRWGRDTEREGSKCRKFKGKAFILWPWRSAGVERTYIFEPSLLGSLRSSPAPTSSSLSLRL